MQESHDLTLVETVRAAALPLSGAPTDYDALLGRIAGARIVLLGEASHGTHEFYYERAELTKRLIREHGVTAVAVEADWPDAARVNRFVRGADGDADAALGAFERFPTWMWRNIVVRDFVAWLRAHNDALGSDQPRVGFYGLDLYSLSSSISAVLRYLEQVDPAAAQRARERYACFEHHGDDPQRYGYAASFDLTQSCEDEVIAQLRELQRQAGEYARRDGQAAADTYFYAEQNARLAANAEAYYRTMFRGRVASWNLRDTHMVETLEALVEHLDRRGQPSKVVVWAHNSHLGDARATEMGAEGELNVGQLVRERFGSEAFLVGFSTNSGTVTAAADWGAPAQQMRVRPGLRGSYESLFHAVGIPRFLLPLRDGGPAADALRGPYLERAIGVIYRPETERLSHYFEARLPEQFDALLHFDDTRAVEPLDAVSTRTAGEPPETFPSGE